MWPCTILAASWAANIRRDRDDHRLLIECAYFDPEHIALTGQKLGLASDARSRFERGVDPAFLETGSARDRAGARTGRRRAAQLRPRRGSRRTRRRSSTTIPRCAGLGGLAVARGPAAAHPGAARIYRDPRRLARHCADTGVATSTDRPTSSRKSSASRARPGASTPLPRAPGVARPTATAEQLAERRVRRTAAARGLNEAVTWSFIAEPRPRCSAAGPGCSPIRSARR